MFVSQHTCRLRLLRLGIYALLLATFFEGCTGIDQECSASIPCKSGCCSEWGFCGLGPEYCAKDVCVNNCDRKGDCDPGGWGEDFVVKSKCPLNVCCSRHGFCGYTEEYCGDKKVKRPSCPVDRTKGFSRVVGYYEGWAITRGCTKFYPERIPTGVYTHLNFAFAGIDPVSFEIVTARSRDIDLYRRLALLKKRDPSLKVMIAIGGWTFNDPGPTATTFSDIARDQNAQKKFIRSLLSFLTTFKFDGVDLDWEYPGADDRSGRPEDFENFPAFMKNLKKSLGNYEVSITLPASYWYLQHFDIKSLSPHVDFFNMMTYDFHGTWDQNSQGAGPFLNAHTNLTEIREGLDLLWRNGINPDKVVLGLAFYGRGFTATSPDCLEPGCTFESGSPAQDCSGEVSVVLNSEIDTIIEETGARPKMDNEAAVKMLTWDNVNWVAYDDEATWLKKTDFARGQCLGGVMVWAVTHDTIEAKYSKILGKVAKRLYEPPQAVGGDGYEEVTKYKPQCRWTNCDENCPSNWIRMLRKDGGARGQEFMVDDAGCGGFGAHQLCCPPDAEPPTCGWYNHNNGKCDNKCPEGSVEIGSNSAYCRYGSFGRIGVLSYQSYQAACCSTDTESMQLYSQCSWASWPLCQLGSCDRDTVALSTTGSGDAICSGAQDRTSVSDALKNKYCCNQDDENSRWGKCEWYGGAASTSASFSDNFCHANCPSDRVRVSMEQMGCPGGTAKAQCCKPEYKTVTKEQSSTDEHYEEVLESFLDDATCENTGLFETDPMLGGLQIRANSLDGSQANESVALLQGRLSTEDFKLEQERVMIALIGALFWATPTQSRIDLWNRQISVSSFRSLSYESVVDYLLRGPGQYIYWSYGPTQGPTYFTCNLDYLNEQVAEGGGGGGDEPGTTTCACVRPDCCPPYDDECVEHDPDQGLQRRGFSRPGVIATLAPRGVAQNYEIDYTDPAGVAHVFTLRAPSYTSTGEFDMTVDVNKFRSAWSFDPNCLVFDPLMVDIRRGWTGFHSDHPFERKSMVMWGTDSLEGMIPHRSSDDGVPYLRNGQQYRVPVRFWEVTMHKNLPSLGGRRPIDEIMRALGSKDNRGPMTLVVGQLNGLKERLWLRNKDIIASRTMENLIWPPNDIPEVDEVLLQIRNIITTYLWHDENDPNDHLKMVIRDIRVVLREAEKDHRATFQEDVYAVAHFDDWTKAHLRVIKERVQDFALKWTGNLLDEFTLSAAVRNRISNIRLRAQGLGDIKQAGFYPQLP